MIYRKDNYYDKLKNFTKNNFEVVTDFDRTIEDIIRYKKHTLSESQEQMMSRIAGFSSTDDIFSILSNLEMNHGSFIDENGKEIKLSPQNYNLCMNSPNAETRRRVMEAYYGEYGRLSQTYAGLLSSHIKYKNFLFLNKRKGYFIYERKN